MTELSWDVWGPPLVVLLVGVVVGLVVALRARGGGVEPAASDAEALAARKDMLMEQLRAMEADRDKLDPSEFAARREALVSEAALVLRSFDELQAAAPQPGPAPAAGASPRPADGAPAQPAEAGRATQRLAWGAGLLGFFILLGVGLSEFSKPRAEGGTMTGGVGEGSAAPQAAASAEVQAAQAALEADPNDLAALNTVTYAALLKGDLQQGMALVDRARALAPQDADVRIHLAMLRLAVNMNDSAIEGLQAVIADRPDYGRPRLWMGLAHLNNGANPLAEEALAAALERDLRSDERGFAQQLLAQARRPPATAGAAASAGAPAQAASAEPPAVADQRLSGTLSLGASVEAQPGQTVFVIVHRNAEGKGPPVAAKRLPGAALPTEFWFTDADQMMGGAWPEQVWLFARLDADGVAGASEGDVESERLGPLSKGSAGVELRIGD